MWGIDGISDLTRGCIWGAHPIAYFNSSCLLKTTADGCISKIHSIKTKQNKKHRKQNEKNKIKQCQDKNSSCIQVV